MHFVTIILLPLLSSLSSFIVTLPTFSTFNDQSSFTIVIKLVSFSFTNVFRNFEYLPFSRPPSSYPVADSPFAHPPFASFPSLFTLEIPSVLSPLSRFRTLSISLPSLPRPNLSLSSQRHHNPSTQLTFQTLQSSSVSTFFLFFFLLFFPPLFFWGTGEEKGTRGREVSP